MKYYEWCLFLWVCFNPLFRFSKDMSHHLEIPIFHSWEIFLSYLLIQFFSFLYWNFYYLEVGSLGSIFLSPFYNVLWFFSFFHFIVKFSLSSNPSLSFYFSYPTSISKSFRVLCVCVFLLITFCFFVMSSNPMFSLKIYTSLCPVFRSQHSLCFL